MNGTTTFGSAAPAWTTAQLTLCRAGGQQGFCMDANVGSAVCTGLATYPSSCSGNSLCCTPQPCALTNTTSGVCLPPTECLNQAGFVTPGYCGANGVDGTTSCCTGAGQALCDTDGLLACLLADGDASTCAASFNCPPLPDYGNINSNVQSAPSAGALAHSNFDVPPSDDPSGGGGDGGDGLSAGMALSPAWMVAVVMVILAVLMQ